MRKLFKISSAIFLSFGAIVIFISFFGLRIAYGADSALVLAAKKEGELILYSGAPRRMEANLVEEFQKRYGIRVTHVRKGSGGIITMVEAERQAGIKKVDVVDHADPGTFYRWKEEKIFVKYRPEGAGSVDKVYVDPDWELLPMFPIYQLPIYNKNLVAKEKVPKSWKDLLDPQWSGRIVHGDPDYSGNVTNQVNCMVKLFGWDFYEKLSKNNVILVESATAVPRMVLTGEALIGAASPDGDTREYTMKGEPLAFAYPVEGSIFLIFYGAILKTAPNPNAAKLWMDFVFSKEGQKQIVDFGFTSVRNDVTISEESKMIKSMKMISPDFKWLMEHKDEQNKKFHEILKKK